MYDHLSCGRIFYFLRYELPGFLGLVIAGAVLQVVDIELEATDLLLWAVVRPGDGDRGG